MNLKIQPNYRIHLHCIHDAWLHCLQSSLIAVVCMFFYINLWMDLGPAREKKQSEETGYFILVKRMFFFFFFNKLAFKMSPLTCLYSRVMGRPLHLFCSRWSIVSSECHHGNWSTYKKNSNNSPYSYTHTYSIQSAGESKRLSSWHCHTSSWSSSLMRHHGSVLMTLSICLSILSASLPLMHLHG